MILIGYSGHAFVVYGIVQAAGKQVTGYCDVVEKAYNPFQLPWYGAENSEKAIEAMRKYGFFIAVGDNLLRRKIYDNLKAGDLIPGNAIHPAAMIDNSATIAAAGVMVAAQAVINPLAVIGTGVICNTACIIEHECVVGDFAHIGPGAVLCGNVKIGAGSFVGANAVIKQGITVGKNTMIGAGAVVVKNVPDDATVVGVPAK
ncbi:MAG: acetyltransferase [Chitinophagaceae bacterium]|nr:acetyltransferase [Chitinophagaceae bacterium]